MAVNIILNAKTQRVGVCNACESLLVHENVKEKLLPVLAEQSAGESMSKCVPTRKHKTLMPGAVAATEEDWGTEYLDYILSIKVVHNVEEAIAHINQVQHRPFRGDHHRELHAMHRNSWMR